jgi:hypothetical protein
LRSRTVSVIVSTPEGIKVEANVTSSSEAELAADIVAMAQGVAEAFNALNISSTTTTTSSNTAAPITEDVAVVDSKHTSDVFGTPQPAFRNLTVPPEADTLQSPSVSCAPKLQASPEVRPPTATKVGQPPCPAT